MKLEDLIETAQLAQLSLDKNELERVFPAFEHMISFFSSMQTADTDQAVFETPITELPETRNGVNANHFRPDKADSDINNPQGSVSNNLVEEMLSNAGERNGRFIVVPNVL